MTSFRTELDVIDVEEDEGEEFDSGDESQGSPNLSHESLGCYLVHSVVRLIPNKYRPRFVYNVHQVRVC